ncbi:hypothetical protein ACQUD0_04565 [Vagococcus fluvialis]|uniref:hypothetical protein n=1 Tax=Vagococcus fluvialis TaxID=2738 RepID=UPI003D0E0695
MGIARPMWYLKRWKYLERNRNRLDDDDKRMGVLLFNALNRMSEENRQILKEKYYDPDNPALFSEYFNDYTVNVPVSDTEIAKKLNIDPYHYRKIRVKAESEFMKFVKEVDEEINIKSRMVNLAIKDNFYIKRIDSNQDKTWNNYWYVSAEVILTVSHKEALSFDTVDEDVLSLVEHYERNGFNRCETYKY